MRIDPRGLHDYGVNGYVLVQVPNAPLILALIGSIAGRLLDGHPTPYFIARALFFIGLSVWAWLELTEGVNAFRRLLGAAGLAWTVYLLQDDLSASDAQSS